MSFFKSKRVRYTFITALGFGGIYLVSRQYFFIGRAYHLYTPDWSAKNFLWIAGLLSCIPGIFGFYRFSLIALLGYTVGVVFGEIFGPTTRILDQGLPPMPVHDGWILSIVTFFAFCIAGIIYELFLKKQAH